METRSAAWDARLGTAGGPRVGAALRALVAARDSAEPAFAGAAEIDPARLDRVYAGEERLTLAELTRVARTLRLRAIEFLQKTEMLSLEVYAGGLDPLYFLPAGQTRHDARIYMREINPRHAVPERDMTKRNPALKALADDSLLDADGRLELELAYLLRVASQATGGTL